jgi:hypothetical protein
MSRLVYMILGLLLWACKSHIPPPGAAILVRPENNNNCLFTGPTSQTAVVAFSWIASENTDSYRLVIQDEETQKRIQSKVDTTLIDLTIPRGFPYSWWVISTSESSSEETKSEVFTFYLEGERQTSHLPFPAELISPIQASTVSVGQSGQINLVWSGVDLDNDIAQYELYFGPNEDQMDLVFWDGLATSFSVSVIAEATYFWQVITIDSEGSRSTSSMNYFYTE